MTESVKQCESVKQSDIYIYICIYIYIYIYILIIDCRFPSEKTILLHSIIYTCLVIFRPTTGINIHLKAR